MRGAARQHSLLRRERRPGDDWVLGKVEEPTFGLEELTRARVFRDASASSCVPAALVVQSHGHAFTPAVQHTPMINTCFRPPQVGENDVLLLPCPPESVVPSSQHPDLHIRCSLTPAPYTGRRQRRAAVARLLRRRAARRRAARDGLPEGGGRRRAGAQLRGGGGQRQAGGHGEKREGREGAWVSWGVGQEE